jgi:N-acetylmuramoyl-L-alanine amidase
MSRKTVVIDPGHGGKDPGAIAGDGTWESTLNLQLALQFQSEARAAYAFDVVLLRELDVSMSLAERVEAANKIEAACVLSFHCNAAESPAASGFEVFTSPGDTPADALATYIYEELDLALPYGGRPDLDDGDPDKEARFYMLRHTKAPAVLVEFGFVSNAGDLEVLNDYSYQDVMVSALCMAVQDWLVERGTRA